MGTRTKTEAQRLNWVRFNQAKLRTEAYGVLRDWAAQQHHAPAPPASTDGATSMAPKVGRPVILPSSFGGGARAMQQNYQGAMAIVRRYGKPDYFITCTANPAWPEIASNLAPGEHAANRPDLVARVFHHKLRALLSDLIDKSALGVDSTCTWTLEFQKPGMPHTPRIIVLRPAGGPRAPEAANRLVF